MTTAQSIITAINARLGAVDGVTVLAYEPTAMVPPTAYTLVMGVGYEASGGMVAVHYRVRVRLCLLWQSSAVAETEGLIWLETIPTALGGGVLAETGGARLALTGAELGFATIGGVKVRTIDFTCAVDVGAVREGVC
jgi:hypothetical protein